MVFAPSLIPDAPSSPKIGILSGPTASGKTQIAIEFAASHPQIEIINADSLQVYRGMDIGTAKPSPEEQAKIRHHLIDILDPNETFTAGEFYRQATAAIEDIHRRGKRALIAGGTGFYLKALLYGLWEAPPANPEIRAELDLREDSSLFQELSEKDPEAARKTGPHDRYRLIRALEIIRLSGRTPTELQASVPKDPDPRYALWVVDRPNADLHSRIALRTAKMLEEGLIEETQRIRSFFPGSRALSSVGYAQVIQHLEGMTPSGRKIRPGLEGLREEIELATRQLVKSQRTWFRGQKTAGLFDLFLMEEQRELLWSEMEAFFGVVKPDRKQ